MVMILTINQVKGGIGKTTTATNLAAGLARRGFKVMIIDTDPQANCTTALCPVTPERTIKNVFDGMPIEKAIYPSVEKNLDILPSCLAFAGTEVELAGRLARELILKENLASIKDNFDYIIIDTQPSLGIIPLNALCVADEVLIPVHEAYALDAISQMSDVILQVRSKVNPDLKICGVLLTMYDPRTSLAKEVRQALLDKFGGLVFETTIPRNVKLAECPSHKQTIYEYAPDSAGAIAYRAFTTEILNRWGML